MAASGEMLGAAIGAMLRDGLVYVVRPDGEIVEVAIGEWYGRGQPFLTRVAAEAASLKIKWRD